MSQGEATLDPSRAASRDSRALIRDVGVVIVAGGSGTRVGGEELKQFRWVAGKPMLLHSVQTFMARPDVGMVVVVLPQRYAGDPPPWLFQCDVDRLLVSLGGRTRSESVANGLDDLPDEAQIVLVHDAARPLVGDGDDRSRRERGARGAERRRRAPRRRHAQGGGRCRTHHAHGRSRAALARADAAGLSRAR